MAGYPTKTQYQPFFYIGDAVKPTWVKSYAM
jgi:hypothetical protein